MDADTIRRLNDINRQFYAQTAPHFNQTRNAAWAGWAKLLPHLQFTESVRVLDVGCGNGRFGLFMAEHFANIQYTGVDNSPALLNFAQESLSDKISKLTLQEQDIVQQLLPSGEFDLVVLFGVIHHIPGYANRQAFIQQLAERVAPNGYLVFASWRFYEQARFRGRIVAWADDFQVEENDYLLDWRQGTTALRYCHYVDDAEQTAIIQAISLNEIITFRADGKTQDLNCYSLLQRSES